MADEVTACHGEHHVCAWTSVHPTVQGDGVNVRYEIGFRETVPELIDTSAEILPVGRVVPIVEDHGAVKDQFGARKKVERRRRVGRSVEPHRLVALAVEDLMPRVERDGKDAAFLPFKRLLRLTLISVESTSVFPL